VSRFLQENVSATWPRSREPEDLPASVVVLVTALCGWSASPWLQCDAVNVLPHALPAAARRVGGVSVVIGQRSRAVAQGRHNAIGQGDALWEGPAAGRVSVEVVAVCNQVGGVGRQAVALKDEVAVVVFVIIITVALGNAVAVVTMTDNND